MDRYDFYTTKNDNMWVCYIHHHGRSTSAPSINENTDSPVTNMWHSVFVLSIAELLIAGIVEGYKVNRQQTNAPPVPRGNGPTHQFIKSRTQWARKCHQCNIDGKKTSSGKKKETRGCCDDCDVNLCQGSCFIRFHNSVSDPSTSTQNWLFLLYSPWWLCNSVLKNLFTREHNIIINVIANYTPSSLVIAVKKLKSV